MYTPARAKDDRKRKGSTSPFQIQTDPLLATGAKSYNLKKSKLQQSTITAFMTEDTDRNTSYEDYLEATMSKAELSQASPATTTPLSSSPIPDEAFTSTLNAVTMELTKAFGKPEVQNAIRPMITLILREQIDKFITSLRKEIHDLKYELSSVTLQLNGMLNERCDDLEQYGRRNCIRISGIAETPNEIVENKVIDVLKQVIPDIAPSDIQNSHRVGKPIMGNPQKIIVRLSNYKTKVSIMRGKKVVNSAEDNIYINEDLTRYRAHIFKHTRKSFKSNLINGCWTRDGKIFIRERKPDGTDGLITRITSTVQIPGYKPSPEELLNFNLSQNTHSEPESTAV
ncbi:hypothetical protein SNE40_009632 [Patella caerulea]|uniref:Uncharacterized protein n=1 Tax=Patella caerulea TaxID=87958 RepID=A0AAN8JZF6_PATCE